MASQLCENKKPDGSWCGVPIEWKISKAGNKYPAEVDNGRLHKCPYYDPSKKKSTTPTNDHAKQIVQEYKQKFPDDNEHLKKIELGISQQIELATQAVLLQRDTIRLAKGEEIEVILAQKDEEIAGLKEALRQQGLTNAKGDKV